MRALLLALVFAVPLSAQTLTGGLGVAGWGGDAELLAVGGTLAVPVGDWTVGAHGLYAEEIVLSQIWADWQATGALLAGRSGQSSVVRWTALAGPSLSRAYRQPNTGRDEPDAQFEPGVMGRVQGVFVPFPSVPVGLSLDLGLNVSTGAVTTTVLPGLAVRLGR